MRKPLRQIVTCSLVLIALLAAASAQAQTLAYWRFEGGPAFANVTHGAAPGYNYAADVPDVSGSGNALSVWETNGCCGFAYRSDVPWSNVPQTGAANNFSIKNTGGFPASFTNPAAALSNNAFSQWTVEASWKPEIGGFRTVVGRDAQNVSTSDPNLAAYYLGATPANELRVLFTDEAGFTHQATSAPGVVTGFNFGADPEGLTGVWHNIAATSDGSTLSLYLDKGLGYQLLAQTNLTLSGSSNTALTDGLNGAPGGVDIAGAAFWSAGDWSVGRGFYAGGHTDRAYGFIDEVRLSSTALSPSQFLLAAPEPASIAVWTLIGLAVGGFGYLRMRRATIAAR
jgi:hypothetical protein